MAATGRTDQATNPSGAEWWRPLVREELDEEPSYFPDKTVEVSFTFSSGRSVMADEDLLRLLADPAEGQVPLNDLPYHVDLAHALFLNGLDRASAVLEIGCGGGQARRWYESRGLRYVGVDISRTRVEEDLQAFGGPDILCDAHFLPFHDNVFDVVYSAAVFEHLACPVRAMQEARRVLKPGGYLLGNVSFLEPWHDRSYFHMSPLGAIELLAEAGLVPLSVWPSRGYSGFHALTRMNLARWNPGRYLGPVLHVTHGIEQWAKARARSLLKRKAKSLLLQRAHVAGAVDWIAQKPVAGDP